MPKRINKEEKTRIIEALMRGDNSQEDIAAQNAVSQGCFAIIYTL